ncbi:hypothetical protein [Alishewanella longhuensis]
MNVKTSINYLALAVSVALLSACGDTKVNINEKDPIVIENPGHDHDHDEGQCQWTLSAFSPGFCLCTSFGTSR